MPTVSAQRLAEVFVEVADTLAADFDVMDFLRLVAVRTAEVAGAGAVAIVLADEQAQLRFTAASDEDAHLLAAFEVEHLQGPCREAFLTGTAVVASEIAAEAGRWPQFAPRAAQAGFCSLHAVPMRLHGEVLGALILFNRAPGRLAPDDARIVQAVVDLATIGLLQERAVRRGQVLSEQLQGALNSRVVIEQAKGVLSQLHGVSLDEAFELMRGFARRNGRRLNQVARIVVSEDRSSIAELTGSRADRP